MNEDFNNLIVNMLKNGNGCIVPLTTIQLYEKLLGISIVSEPTIKNIYEAISKTISNKYRGGLCARLML
jgi:hypothetical protein